MYPDPLQAYSTVVKARGGRLLRLFFSYLYNFRKGLLNLLVPHFSFFFINLFVCLFIYGCVGSFCCPQAFSSCGERGLLFVVVHRLLIAVASLVAEHGL